ncbi:hypothetical protein MtrunA17_Chr4g0076461 [Medicago truncatula]|uniref:Uncharacterized protein n=1 Tax=Medicago truncatula TaxID=3880 RepID=A0A396IQD2_MEDTR|nr:hypothetical protein MtrunA17_Chr4g0076461 [Medicago truncatula]
MFQVSMKVLPCLYCFYQLPHKHMTQQLVQFHHHQRFQCCHLPPQSHCCCSTLFRMSVNVAP